MYLSVFFLDFYQIGLMYRILYSIAGCLVVCYTICSCSYRFLFNGVPDN